jgi:hypothetical protein
MQPISQILTRQMNAIGEEVAGVSNQDNQTTLNLGHPPD